ncbi:MAG: hypothetical protein U0441_06865 [Polyangiaceae bacterium]
MRSGGWIVSGLLCAGISGCAGAPPAAPSKPSGTSSVVTPPAPSSAETAAPGAPPLTIGEGFAADPNEPLPPGAVVRCGTGKMHVSSPHAMAVTDAGQIWAVDATHDGWKLRDVNHGVDVADIPGEREAVITPDGSTIVAWEKGKRDTLVLYSVAQKKAIGSVFLPSKAPRPKSILEASFGMIGALGSGGPGPKLFVAPDGKAVAALTEDKQAHLVDLTTGKLVKSQKLPAKSRFTGISDRGDRGMLELMLYEEGPLSGMGPRHLIGYQVLDMRKGTKVKRVPFGKVPPAPYEPSNVPVHQHQGAMMRIDATGTRAVLVDGHVLELWDFAKGTLEEQLNLSKAKTESGDAAPSRMGGNGMLGPAVLRISDEEERGFRLIGPQAVLVEDTLVDLAAKKMTGGVASFAAMSPNAKYRVSQRGGSVEMSPGGHDAPNSLAGPVVAVGFASDNRLVLSAGVTRLHHPGTCAPGAPLQQGTGYVAPGPNGLVGLANDSNVAVRKDDKPPVTTPLSRGIKGLATSPEGDRLYTATTAKDGKSAVGWIEPGGQMSPDHTREVDLPVRSLAMAKNGTTLAVSGGDRSDAGAKLWLFDLPRLEKAAEAKVPFSGEVQFAGSELLLLGGYRDGIHGYAAAGLAEKLQIHSVGCCEHIAASPDGTRVAGTTSYGFSVWEVPSRRLLAAVEDAHREPIRSIAFSPDGRYLVTGSADRTALVWQLDKLSVPALTEKAETVAKGADEVRRFFASRSDTYAIGADGKLALRHGKKGTLPSLKSVTMVAGNGKSYCAVAESKVHCWGSTEGGALGVPEKTAGKKGRFTSITRPTTVNVADPVDLRMWDMFGCALSKTGSLTCWGQMDYGDPVLAPKEVASSVKAFALGRSWMCAVLASGGVSCTGPHGATFAKDAARAATVTTGLDHLCMLDSTGAAFCRGPNEHDEVGDNAGMEAADLVEVKALSVVTSIAAAPFGTCAVAARGEAWCWGLFDEAHLDRPVRVKSLDGATELSPEYQRMCGRIGERVDCVTLSGVK